MDQCIEEGNKDNYESHILKNNKQSRYDDM
jgi:hypothetical protein